MQSVSSRIWTRVAVSISYDDNDYTKMVLDAALLNTQNHKVRVMGKVEQSREWSNALPYTSVSSFTYFILILYNIASAL